MGGPGSGRNPEGGQNQYQRASNAYDTKFKISEKINKMNKISSIRNPSIANIKQYHALSKQISSAPHKISWVHDNYKKY